MDKTLSDSEAAAAALKQTIAKLEGEVAEHKQSLEQARRDVADECRAKERELQEKLAAQAETEELAKQMAAERQELGTQFADQLQLVQDDASKTQALLEVDMCSGVNFIC